MGSVLLTTGAFFSAGNNEGVFWTKIIVRTGIEELFC